MCVVDLFFSRSLFLSWSLGSYSPLSRLSVSLSLPGRFNHLSYRTYNRARGGSVFIFPSGCMCSAKKPAGRSALNPQSTSARIGKKWGGKKRKNPERDTRRTVSWRLSRFTPRDGWYPPDLWAGETLRVPGDLWLTRTKRWSIWPW